MQLNVQFKCTIILLTVQSWLKYRYKIVGAINCKIMVKFNTNVDANAKFMEDNIQR